MNFRYKRLMLCVSESTSLYPTFKFCWCQTIQSRFVSDLWILCFHRGLPQRWCFHSSVCWKFFWGKPFVCFHPKCITNRILNCIFHSKKHVFTKKHIPKLVIFLVLFFFRGWKKKQYWKISLKRQSECKIRTHSMFWIDSTFDVLKILSHMTYFDLQIICASTGHENPKNLTIEHPQW